MSVKEGKLEKLGAKFPSWKKRYFVLKDNTLAYYKDKSTFKKVIKCKRFANKIQEDFLSNFHVQSKDPIQIIQLTPDVTCNVVDKKDSKVGSRMGYFRN